MHEKQKEMFERFDKKFPFSIIDWKPGNGLAKDKMIDIKSFLQSEIDLAVAEERKRIVGILIDYYDEVKNVEIGTGEDKLKEMNAISYCIGLAKHSVEGSEKVI